MAPDLYMAWKGVAGVGDRGDAQVYWSSFDRSNWTKQQIVGAPTSDVGSTLAGSDVGPSLAVFRHYLFMAWKPAESLDTSQCGQDSVPSYLCPGDIE